MCKDPCKYQVTDLSHLDNQALQTICIHAAFVLQWAADVSAC